MYSIHISVYTLIQFTLYYRHIHLDELIAHSSLFSSLTSSSANHSEGGQNYDHQAIVLVHISSRYALSQILLLLRQV